MDRTIGCVLACLVAPALVLAQEAVPPAPPQNAVQGRPVARLRVGIGGPYGQIITDEAGHTLYAFSPDEGQGRSTCVGDCADMFPPALAGPTIEHSFELDAAKTGVVRRPDGALQVTYAGWPLYYYAGDRAPDMEEGQGLRAFNGEWHVITSEGRVVTTPPPTE